MTAWGIKRRFFNNISGKGKTTRAERITSVSSVSTEQEDLRGTEENAALTNVVESGEEQRPRSPGVTFLPLFSGEQSAFIGQTY